MDEIPEYLTLSDLEDVCGPWPEWRDAREFDRFFATSLTNRQPHVRWTVDDLLDLSHEFSHHGDLEELARHFIRSPRVIREIDYHSSAVDGILRYSKALFRGLHPNGGYGKLVMHTIRVPNQEFNRWLAETLVRELAGGGMRGGLEVAEWQT